MSCLTFALDALQWFGVAGKSDFEVNVVGSDDGTSLSCVSQLTSNQSQQQTAIPQSRHVMSSVITMVTTAVATPMKRGGHYIVVRPSLVVHVLSLTMCNIEMTGKEDDQVMDL